jgi:hypothetical protein
MSLSFHALSADIHSYLVTELMQTDLREVLDTKSLSHEFVQFFLYQLMVGFSPVIYKTVTNQITRGD